MARQNVVDRRAQLIAVGKDIFSTRPYDTVSTDEIALIAGISKGLLYHYFPGKREFYVATIQVLAAELLAVVPLDPALDPVASARASLDGFLDFVEANANLYRALLRGGIGVDPEVAQVVDGVRRTLVDRLLVLLGASAPTPLARLRLHGWLGFVEVTSLDWLDFASVDRGTLRALWLDTLTFLARPGAT